MTATSFQRQWSEDATLDDVYYCYRLLLKREPDADGLKFWRARLSTESFTVAKLAAYFCQSREYLTAARARGIKMVSFDDFELFIYEHDWDIGEQMLATNRYEPYVTAFLRNEIKPGFTFVDIGANIGYFTVLAAKLTGNLGRTIAIECNPRNCELIFLNLNRNNISNALVYQFAVTDKQKLLSLSAGFSNGAVDELRDGDDAVIVPGVTLDFLLQNEPRIDIIKMDVEGSEAKAWRGMRRLIRRHRPTIVMEFFPTLLEKHSGVRATHFLDEIFLQGYAATVLRPSDTVSADEEDATQRDVTDPESVFLAKASSPSEVMKLWEKRCEEVGDASRTYLDLVWQLPKQNLFASLITRVAARVG